MYIKQNILERAYRAEHLEGICKTDKRVLSRGDFNTSRKKSAFRRRMLSSRPDRKKKRREAQPHGPGGKYDADGQAVIQATMAPFV